MAHKMKIEVRPHKNKDGSDSKTRKDYVVIDRMRKGRREVGVATSLKAANVLISDERERLVSEHLTRHPSDQQFKRKHRIEDGD